MIELAPAPPYVFTGPYAACYARPAMAIDPRHVFILHDILQAWPFQSALELGSFMGASSTAFIETINAGQDMKATFCDRFPTASLETVVGNCKDPSGVRITNDLSWSVLESPEPFDFVLVDAGHTIPSVTPELIELLIRRPLCVMAHDTNATAAGYPHAEGAEMLKKAFQRTAGYLCIEDAQKRDVEETHRGLFLATTSPELFDKAEGIFEKWV